MAGWREALHARSHGRFARSAHVNVTHVAGEHFATDREARTHVTAVNAIKAWQRNPAGGHADVRQALLDHADASGLYSTHHHDELLGQLATHAGLSPEDTDQLHRKVTGRAAR